MASRKTHPAPVKARRASPFARSLSLGLTVAAAAPGTGLSHPRGPNAVPCPQPVHGWTPAPAHAQEAKMNTLPHSDCTGAPRRRHPPGERPFGPPRGDPARRARRITPGHELVARALLKRLGPDGRLDPAQDTLAHDTGLS